MTKRLRVIAVVLFVLTVFGGTASAYESGAWVHVTVSDNGEETTYFTDTMTVEDLLDSENIVLEDGDKIDKSLKYYLAEGTRIEIERASHINVSIDGDMEEMTTDKKTVEEFIEDISSELPEGYKVLKPEVSEKIVNGQTIYIVSPQREERTEEEEIPFETEIRENADLPKGQEKVVQEGQNGLALVTYEDVYMNHALQFSEEVDREIKEEPVNKIIEKGTKTGHVAVDENGPYAQAINMTVTAYTPYDAGCTGITASGTVAQKGVIAVDPSVIPMGTRVYIPGYGDAIAADKGGAIKGNKIDVCFSTKAEAFNWGVQKLTVYIYK
ncbi:MAG: G5 domain-containing protein [Clostridiales bacterium]|nr:G5 domain-containing protein [Clostridiales bacterium]